jgi:hypothetical protein
MSTRPEEQRDHQIDLLHPFYLDTDMSMAFAAALSGGVALEREEVAGDSSESSAVRNLRGNLRLVSALGVGGSREHAEAGTSSTESRLVRQHTEASIFISLYDELRRTRRISEDLEISHVKPGQIVSLEVGPAVAPLRRVVDQLLRLLDVAEPLVADDSPKRVSSGKRQHRRQQSRGGRGPDAGGAEEFGLGQIKALFEALRDDLDRSGMIDVVVHREDAPSIVLTLDKRLVSDQTIELLHTSRFTVVGKVTQVFPSADDVVNLYRRSVISLVPAFTQSVAWGMFAMVASFARAMNPASAQMAAMEAAGVKPEPGAAQSENGHSTHPRAKEDDAKAETVEREDAAGATDDDEGDEDPEVLLGEAIVAFESRGPGASRTDLPLAICA